MFTLTLLLTPWAKQASLTCCLTVLSYPSWATAALSTATVTHTTVQTRTGLSTVRPKPAMGTLQFTGRPGPPVGARASPGETITYTTILTQAVMQAVYPIEAF